MHVVVCIKQVPDAKNVRIDPETCTLVRQGVDSIVNPHDWYAIEAALRFRDQYGVSELNRQYRYWLSSDRAGIDLHTVLLA